MIDLHLGEEVEWVTEVALMNTEEDAEWARALFREGEAEAEKEKGGEWEGEVGGEWEEEDFLQEDQDLVEEELDRQVEEEEEQQEQDQGLTEPGRKQEWETS